MTADSRSYERPKPPPGSPFAPPPDVPSNPAYDDRGIGPGGALALIGIGLVVILTIVLNHAEGG